MSNPDTPNRDPEQRTRLTGGLLPDVITYSNHPATTAETLRCGACGAVVENDDDATDAHSRFHAYLLGILDGAGKRLFNLERAQAEASTAARTAPLPDGTAKRLGLLFGDFLGARELPLGYVRLILDGPTDQVGPAVAGLETLFLLEQSAPIMRDATPPVREQRVYMADVNGIRNAVNRATAARVANVAPRRIPAPDRLDVEAAAQVARHARAVLLHLAALGVALDRGLEHTLDFDGDSELAVFLREVNHWGKALDTWAESTTYRSEVPRGLYEGSGGWCHQAGGVLPVGDLGPAGARPDTRGVVRLELFGDPGDVADALGLLRASAVRSDGTPVPLIAVEPSRGAERADMSGHGAHASLTWDIGGQRHEASRPGGRLDHLDGDGDGE